MKNWCKGFAVLVAFVIAGCGASATEQASVKAPETPKAETYVASIDPNTGDCVKGQSTPDSYTACLEHTLKTERSMTPKTAAKPEEPKQAPPAPPPPQVPAAFPQPVAATMPSGYYYPAAIGSTCEVPDAITLEVENTTDFYLQVYAPTDAVHQYIIPLNCDVPIKMEVLTVLHDATGVVDQVMGIKPRMKSRFVFLPLNGGKGKEIQVNMKGWLLNRVSGGMAQVPSSEMGYASFTYDVPYRGGKNRTQVSAYQLTGH